MNESQSAILQCKTVPKYKDPGCPTISCIIGGCKIDRALLDLGSSVNLLPYSVYKDLGLGELKPTRVTLELADRSVKVPRGIIEDVLIQVDTVYYPVDFIVLDTQPVDVESFKRHIPVILGRPFLATANAVIHCRHGLLKLSFGNMTLETNIFTVGKQMKEVDQIEEINVIESIIQEHVDREFMEDSIERALVWSELHDQLESESVSFRDASIVGKEGESVLHVGHWTPTFEPLAPSVVKPVSSEEKPPIPERKPLPSTLKYAFLGEGWTIADLHGISPLMCTHRIYLEEESKPVRQMQRRLNPNMKEAVRGEVLKLLDAGIIYPISDSKWVSPTQVVPKKSRVTVVKNEHNELVPTRVQTGWRMCIDYRKLNAATRKDHFPLPFLDQVLERVAGRAYYCFLDGYSGYNQIEVALEDQDKTTFTCPFGTYAYRRMPFRSMQCTGHFSKMYLFEWTPQCQEAFDKLKGLLTTAPIIRSPDWSLPFELMCDDASDYAVGAVVLGKG
ncbi:hypothetical protein Acr_07g0011080 [Actinidia rufa]|uniref:Uncharacterized protein n=1 Tax=Actinidia rufa TaxID=165716 RepID=A0A7J0EWZ2_9ERIC|nr:hypothetical protein Acr_07g0011080 [Actinidia rufa]